MLTMEERMDAVRNLNLMNERIEMSKSMIEKCESMLKEMHETYDESVFLRDMYAAILKIEGGDQ